MSYIIVEQDDLKKLVDEVVAWQQKGFKPTGGVSTAVKLERRHEHLSNITYYTQAMCQELFHKDELGMKPIVTDKPKKPSIDDLEVIKWNFSSSVFTPIIEIAYTWKGVHAETTIAEQLPVAIRDEREITVMLFKQLLKDGVI